MFVPAVTFEGPVFVTTRSVTPVTVALVEDESFAGFGSKEPDEVVAVFVSVLWSVTEDAMLTVTVNVADAPFARNAAEQNA